MASSGSSATTPLWIRTLQIALVTLLAIESRLRRSVHDMCPQCRSGRLRVIETAHRIGLRTTATIMFGHLERPEHWARHLQDVPEPLHLPEDLPRPARASARPEQRIPTDTMCFSATASFVTAGLTGAVAIACLVRAGGPRELLLAATPAWAEAGPVVTLLGLQLGFLLGGNPEFHAKSEVARMQFPEIEQKPWETPEAKEQALEEARSQAFKEAFERWKKKCDVEHEEVVEQLGGLAVAPGRFGIAGAEDDFVEFEQEVAYFCAGVLGARAPQNVNTSSRPSRSGAAATSPEAAISSTRSTRRYAAFTSR